MIEKPVSPFPRTVTLGRIDAGQDLNLPQHFYVAAIGSGVCTMFDPPHSRTWGGMGAAYFQLDHPITMHGRTYHYWYTAECGHYLVKVGTRVGVGQHVAYTSSGWTETGFYAHQDMNSQVPTVPGRDFHDFILKMRAQT